MIAIVAALIVGHVDEDKVIVPMKMRGAMPGLEVMVNGRGPYHFGLDTGGQGQARADSSLVKELGLPIVGTQQARRPGGLFEMDVTQFESLQIGSLEFKEVRALSRDYNTGVPLPPIKGIVGFGLFKDHLVTLDYPKKKIEIVAGSLPKPDDKEVLAVNMKRGIPQIKVTLGGKQIDAMVDSGNLAGAIIVTEEIMATLELDGEPQVMGKARGAEGEIEIVGAKLKGSLKIGQYEITGLTVMAMRGGGIGAAVIGAPILTQFRTTYDQKSNRMRFEREGAKSFSLPPKRRGQK